jgi:hypothetical protein
VWIDSSRGRGDVLAAAIVLGSMGAGEWLLATARVVMCTSGTFSCITTMPFYKAGNIKSMPCTEALGQV